MLTSKIFIRPLGAGKMWYQEILECWIWPMNQILIGWINIQSDSIDTQFSHRSFLTDHFRSHVHRKMTKNGLLPKLSILTVAYYFAKKWLANDCTWNINLLVIKRSNLFPRGHFYSEIKISGTFKVTFRSFQGHSKVIKLKDIPVKVFFQMLLKILGYIGQNFEFDLAKGLILGTWLLRSLVLSVPVTHFDLSSSSDLTFWSRDLTKSSYMLSPYFVNSYKNLILHVCPPWF